MPHYPNPNSTFLPIGLNHSPRLAAFTYRVAQAKCLSKNDLSSTLSICVLATGRQTHRGSERRCFIFLGGFFWNICKLLCCFHLVVVLLYISLNFCIIAYCCTRNRNLVLQKRWTFNLLLLGKYTTKPLSQLFPRIIRLFVDKRLHDLLICMMDSFRISRQSHEVY